MDDDLTVGQTRIMVANRTDRVTWKMRMHAVTSRKGLKAVDIIADTQAGLAEVGRVGILQADEEFIQPTITMCLANLIAARKAICWLMRALNKRTSFRFYHQMRIT